MLAGLLLHCAIEKKERKKNVDYIFLKHKKSLKIILFFILSLSLEELNFSFKRDTKLEIVC